MDIVHHHGTSLLQVTEDPSYSNTQCVKETDKVKRSLLESEEDKSMKKSKLEILKGNIDSDRTFIYSIRGHDDVINKLRPEY